MISSHKREIEKIIGRQTRKYSLLYQVLWKGQQLQEITWEPLKNLIDYIEQVKEYERSLKPKKSGTNKESINNEDHDRQINRGLCKDQIGQVKVPFEANIQNKQQIIMPSSPDQHKQEKQEILREDKNYFEDENAMNNQDHCQQQNENQIPRQAKIEPIKSFEEIKIVVKSSAKDTLNSHNNSSIVNPILSLLQKKIDFDEKHINFDELYEQETALMRLGFLNPRMQYGCPQDRKLKVAEMHNLTKQVISTNSNLNLLGNQKDMCVKQIFKINGNWYTIINYSSNIGIFNANKICQSYPNAIKKYLGDLFP